MSGDDAAARSLEEQAATWVPPWERPPAPEPLEAAEPEPEASVEAEPTEPEPEPVSAAEPEPEPEPVPPAILEDLVPVFVPNSPRSDEGGEAEPEAGGEAGDFAEAEGDAEVADDEGLLAEPTNAILFEDPIELRGALEAILLVVDEPVTEVTLAQALDLPMDLVHRALGELAVEYRAHRRGFELRQAAGGWRLYTRSDYAAYVERFVLDGQQLRLTQAALETLAVIAYKQPVTRSRISAIRGVNCDGVVRTLVTRGLIEDCGSEPDSGAFLYRTTPLFLEKLGINSIDELPPLAPFLPDDVDEIANAQG